MRLDHGVFRVLLDLMLELGDHMAGRDDEAPRVVTYGFVLIAMKRDESIAAELPALAAERDDAIGRLGVDALVERAEGRLAACDAPRVQLKAGRVAEEIHRLHPCSRLAGTLAGLRWFTSTNPEARLARLDGSSISKRKAHVHTSADFALDDQELVAEIRHEAESDPKSGAVVARGHSDAVVAHDDPDALVVLSQS